MVAIQSFIAFAFGALALAAPTSTVEEAPTRVVARQASGATCGSNKYTAAKITAARTAGCNYLKNGQTVGSNDYPHRYNNYEGFDFTVPSPWYEFPILASGKTFDGSTSPSTDRVIFNSACQLADVITHTGASGNNFVECDY